jgi:hypothetical protein
MVGVYVFSLLYSLVLRNFLTAQVIDNFHCIISLPRYMRNTKKLLMLYAMRGWEEDMQKLFWKG